MKGEKYIRNEKRSNNNETGKGRVGNGKGRRDQDG